MLKRPSNLPRDEIRQRAEDAIREHGGPLLCRVFYKFDCGTCGARCFCPEPNVLPLEGVCWVCKAVTVISGGGFMLHRRESVNVPWDSENLLYVRKRYESDRGDA